MPIYGYECKDCGVRFERRQSFSDDPIAVCPECEGDVRRLLEPAGIIFKGSGFYVTDNRGSKSSLTSSKKDGDNGSSSTSGSGESASASSESTSSSSESTSPGSESKSGTPAKSESKKSD